MITQKKDDTLQLPDGVAYTLDANQMIRIEMHYINPTTDPVDVTATTNIIAMDDSQFQNEADFLFIGDPDIKIPPNSTTTLGPIFFQLPTEYAAARTSSPSPGTSTSCGTNVTVSDRRPARPTPGTSVYDVPNWLWSEPTTVVSRPAVHDPRRTAASRSPATGTTRRPTR